MCNFFVKSENMLIIPFEYMQKWQIVVYII